MCIRDSSCSTVATISLGHMLLMANPLTRAYIGTTAAVDDTVTVTNDVRSALQEWDLDSNNILTYAEVTACLATYHVNVTNLDDANNYVWSVPVPEPIVASTDDCETADSLYTVSIVQNTGAISDTDDFKMMLSQVRPPLLERPPPKPRTHVCAPTPAQVNMLYLGTQVLILLDLSYISRFWCARCAA